MLLQFLFDLGAGFGVILHKAFGLQIGPTGGKLRKDLIAGLDYLERETTFAAAEREPVSNEI